MWVEVEKCGSLLDAKTVEANQMPLRVCGHCETPVGPVQSPSKSQAKKKPSFIPPPTHTYKNK